MRMWKVSPSIMCNKHLLGEHVEMHMFVGAMSKTNQSMNGYASTSLVEIHHIKERHDELVVEMLERNMGHGTPIKHEDINHRMPFGFVHVKFNYWELARRCVKCRAKIAKSIVYRSLDLLPDLTGSEQKELLQFIAELEVWE